MSCPANIFVLAALNLQLQLQADAFSESRTVRVTPRSRLNVPVRSLRRLVQEALEGLDDVAGVEVVVRHRHLRNVEWNRLF